MHDLRHTYASLARRAGADLRLLQKTMGHASIPVTAHIYADLYDDELDDIASALDALDDGRGDGRQVWPDRARGGDVGGANPAARLGLCGFDGWSRLVSNQRPSACEADALPLSYETREAPINDRWTTNIITHGLRPENPDGGHGGRPGGMVPAITLRAGLLTLALASSLLSSCAGQTAAPASTSGSLTRITTTEGRSSHSRCTESIETGNKASPTTGPQTLTDLVGFASPSGNVGCYLDPSTARCEISERDWSPPPRPADCEFDYGQGINLAAGEAPTR